MCTIKVKNTATFHSRNKLSAKSPSAADFLSSFFFFLSTACLQIIDDEREKKNERRKCDDIKASWHVAQAGGRLVEADRPGLKAKLLPGIAIILGQEVGDGQTVQLTGLHLKHCEPILSTILKTHRPHPKVNTRHTRLQQEKGQERTTHGATESGPVFTVSRNPFSQHL